MMNCVFWFFLSYCAVKNDVFVFLWNCCVFSLVFVFSSFLYGIAVGYRREGRQQREDWVFCVTISLL